jgi:hypothetical protein
MATLNQRRPAWRGLWVHYDRMHADCAQPVCRSKFVPLLLKSVKNLRSSVCKV